MTVDLLKSCLVRLCQSKRRRYPDSEEVAYEGLDEDLKHDFHEAIRRFLAGKGDAASWKPVWTLMKPRSTVLVIEFGPEQRRLFLKRESSGRGPDSERAARGPEQGFDWTLRVQQEMPTVDGCACVPIVAAYPDLQVLVFEYVWGHSLEAMILDAGRFLGGGRAETLELISRAARWLACFGQAIGSLHEEVGASSFSDSFQSQWDTFQRRYPRLARTFSVDRLTAWAETECRELSPGDRKAALCHGDYGPFNILVNEHGNLVVIDFESRFAGSRASDACYFLHQLWKVQFNPTISRSFIAESLRVFAETFGLRHVCSDHLIMLERARRLMGTLAYLGGERTPPAAVFSWHDRYIAATCLHHLRQLMAGVTPRSWL